MRRFTAGKTSSLRFNIVYFKRKSVKRNQSVIKIYRFRAIIAGSETLMNEDFKDLPKNPESLSETEPNEIRPLEKFASEELVVCPKCRRKNPPTKFACLYCGAELEIDPLNTKASASAARPSLEPHEKGYNVICRASGEKPDTLKLAEAARISGLSVDSLEKIFDLEARLPLLRVALENEAEILRRKLLETGIDAKIIRDDDFFENRPVRRLRRIEFFDDRIILILFNRDEIFEAAPRDFQMIVAGKLFEKKIEATEKHERKKNNSVLDQFEVTADELIFDLFVKGDETGFRVLQKGFDFSCLGAAKKFLAAENIKILISRLLEFAPEAVFDDNYLKLRETINAVWKQDESKNSGGLERMGFGKFNRRRVITTDNLRQFTKYSRLQKMILFGEK